MSGATTTDLSMARGAWFLWLLSLRQMLRVRQLVGISLALLAVALLIVGLVTTRLGWDRTEARLKQEGEPKDFGLVLGGVAVPALVESPAYQRIAAENAPGAVFSRSVVFLLFLGFLLPIWTLSFASSALGAEREARSLLWLLSRPLPREAIYGVKLLAALPWCLALNLGGFALICLAGGEPGRQALRLYWPGVAAATVAFTALFHLLGALVERPAVAGLIYAFFFEAVLSELPVPGTVKRLSVNYYARCLMYRAAEGEGIPTESRTLFVPVGDATAWLVLLGGALVLSLVGMRRFARQEFRDE